MEDRFNTPHTSAIELEVLGHTLFLSQDPNSKHVGTTVWDASVVFVKFLEKHSKKGEFSRAKIAGKRVIELGAGCGLAGLGMALLGCQVVATDQTSVLPLLLRNTERNMDRARALSADYSYMGPIGTVDVAELDWGNKVHIAAVEPPFDYIIGTDLVYGEQLLEPLISTILLLAGPKSTVLLGYEFRSTGVHEKLHQLSRAEFDVRRVPHSKMDPKYQHPNIDLFIMKRHSTPQSSVGISHDTHLTSISELSSLSDEESEGKCSIWRLKLEDESVAVQMDRTSTSKTPDGESSMAAAIETSTLTRETGVTAQECRFESCINLASQQREQEITSDKPPDEGMSDWELRRLGSTAARLLSGVALPSEERSYQEPHSSCMQRLGFISEMDSP